MDHDEQGALLGAMSSAWFSLLGWACADYFCGQFVLADAATFWEHGLEIILIHYPAPHLCAHTRLLDLIESNRIFQQWYYVPNWPETLLELNES